jgi:hypothetical protein
MHRWSRKLAIEVQWRIASEGLSETRCLRKSTSRCFHFIFADIVAILLPPSDACKVALCIFGPALIWWARTD